MKLCSVKKPQFQRQFEATKFRHLDDIPECAELVKRYDRALTNEHTEIGEVLELLRAFSELRPNVSKDNVDVLDLAIARLLQNCDQFSHKETESILEFSKILTPTIKHKLQAHWAKSLANDLIKEDKQWDSAPARNCYEKQIAFAARLNKANKITQPLIDESNTLPSIDEHQASICRMLAIRRLAKLPADKILPSDIEALICEFAPFSELSGSLDYMQKSSRAGVIIDLGGINHLETIYDKGARRVTLRATDMTEYTSFDQLAALLIEFIYPTIRLDSEKTNIKMLQKLLLLCNGLGKDLRFFGVVEGSLECMRLLLPRLTKFNKVSVFAKTNLGLSHSEVCTIEDQIHSIAFRNNIVSDLHAGKDVTFEKFSGCELNLDSFISDYYFFKLILDCPDCEQLHAEAEERLNHLIDNCKLDKYHHSNQHLDRQQRVLCIIDQYACQPASFGFESKISIEHFFKTQLIPFTLKKASFAECIELICKYSNADEPHQHDFAAYLYKALFSNKHNTQLDPQQLLLARMLLSLSDADFVEGSVKLFSNYASKHLAKLEFKPQEDGSLVDVLACNAEASEQMLESMTSLIKTLDLKDLTLDQSLEELIQGSSLSYN